MGITMAHAHRWNRGKLIVVDGSDGVGKGTQVALLVKRLKKDRVRVKTMDFPQYEKNFCGALIRRCLSGTFGNFLNTDPYIASILYAAAQRFLLAGWLLWLSWKERRFKAGFIFWNFALFEGLSRFLIDFWREDTLYFSQTLTMGQILSSIMIIVAVIMLYKNHTEDWKNVW